MKNKQPLSPREIEVLQLIVDGLTNKQVAQHLGIPQKTVYNHMNSIHRKLDHLIEDLKQS